MSELSSRYGRVMLMNEDDYAVDQIDIALGDGAIDLIYQDLRNVSIVPTRQTINHPRVRSSHSGIKHTTIADHAVVSFEMPLTPMIDAAAGDEVPYYRDVLLASNMKETLVSGVSSTYKPATKQQGSFTIYHWEEELESERQRLTYSTGVRGNLTYKFSLNEEAMAQFDGIGLYEGEISNDFAFFNSDGEIAYRKTGVNSVTARTTGEQKYAAMDAFVCSNMVVKVANISYGISSIEFSNNWEVVQKQVVNADGNVIKVLLVRGENSRVGGSFNMVDGTSGIEALVNGLAINDGTASLEIELTRGARKITITGTIQLGPPTKGDASGIRTYDVPFFFIGDFSTLVADNDYSIVYT